VHPTELAAQIRVALASHAMWKHHLANAVLTGRAPRPVEEVRREDACAFGAWLLGVPALRAEPDFGEVRRMHASFHEAAALVLSRVQEGQLDAARQALDEGGAFERSSRELHAALERWVARR